MHDQQKTQGFLGECKALSYAIKEQGYKSLHTHIIIWIKGYHHMLDDALFGTLPAQQKVKKEAAAYDHMSHTHLFGNFLDWQLNKYLMHECKNARIQEQ